MPDELDLAQDRAQIANDDAIRKALKNLRPPEPGQPGECDLCGQWSGRLVRGVCAPCRDLYKLP